MLLRRYHDKIEASESIVSNVKDVNNSIVYEEMTKSEIIPELKKRNIDFKTRQSKSRITRFINGK